MYLICYEAVWCVISVWKLGRISPTCYARGLSDCYMFITLSWKSLLFFQIRASPGILSANVSRSPDVWWWISQFFVCVFFFNCRLSLSPVLQPESFEGSAFCGDENYFAAQSYNYTSVCPYYHSTRSELFKLFEF